MRITQSKNNGVIVLFSASKSKIADQWSDPAATAQQMSRK
jgi:hypothetical protein